MLHRALEESFETLLAAWHRYRDASEEGAGVRRLARERQLLDEQRNRIRRLRKGLHPEGREVEEVALASHCEVLDATVFVPYLDIRRLEGFLSFECLCGEQILHGTAT